MTLATENFGRNITGSRGTIFWNAPHIEPMRVEVLSSGDDSVRVNVWDEEPVLEIPFSSIAYYQYAGEDD